MSRNLMKCLRRSVSIKLIGLILFMTLVLPLILMLRTNTNDISDRVAKLKEINNTIKQQQSGKACKHRNLPVNSPELSKYFQPVAPINCSQTIDWVIVEGSLCYITDEAKKKFGEIYCQFTDLIRSNDFSTTDGHTTSTNTQYQLTTSDLVRVECKASSGAHWQMVLNGIRYDPKLYEKKFKKNPNMLDVLMFGLDSMSHNTFIRKLPKTYKYLTEVLHAKVLNEYNIVGDGTPQALLPILTGMNELELPEARKRVSGSGFVDVFPFIWKQFADLGYVTAFMEDMPFIGTFQYRLNGFKEAPTDHYMRPFYIHAASYIAKSRPMCLGGQPQYKMMLNYIEQLFHSYRSYNKFVFGFHAELSHDSINLVGAADNELQQWLRRLHTSGALNNTMFIFMSDHGSRFSNVRQSLQGKLEERLPFFSITLPEWFKKKYPIAYNNLEKNVDRLTTPYDIYPTIKHLLNLKHFKRGVLTQRSISLFNEVPEERSCADAYIEPHWCACLNWDNIPTQGNFAETLANTLVTKLNQITHKVRILCAKLSLNKIFWITKLSHNDQFLKFKQSKDSDGFVPDLSDAMKVSSIMYQIQIETSPNMGIYEASITHYSNDTFSVSGRDISRVNKYGSQPECIFDTYPDLRKYCYCDRHDSENKIEQ